MLLQTFGELRTKVEKDLDLETEDFIHPDEMIGLFNEAVDECEAEIHKLGMEDQYFQKNTNITLQEGQEEYDLPSDIYANKIRGVMYENGPTIYEIKRLRKDIFKTYAYLKQHPSSSTYYTYTIVNPALGEKPRLLLVPKSRETSPTALRLWYIRNANRMSDDQSVCDIPEFYTFIVKFVKWKVLQKEGNPGEASAKDELEQQRKLMVETLENMVPDDDSTIPGDYTSYEEMS